MKLPALPDPWWRIIGPWPFRPALLGPVMAIYLSGLRNSQRISEGNVFDLEWLTEGTFVAVLMAVPFTLVLYLGVLWQRRFGVKPAAYIAFHVLAVTVAVAERFLVGDVTTDVLTDAPTIVTAILRISVVVFIFTAIAGRTSQRLSEQVQETQKALNLTRAQQSILLRGDELTRRQIAGTLHDRVQARLIAACLELQMMDLHDSERTQATVESVVNQLESVRAVDVRRVARALSPQLSEVDLESALEELALQYDPGMHTVISVDPTLDRLGRTVPQATLLGCYRIIEQALLNAAGHGAARRCEVAVSIVDAQLRLTVRDDGRGFTQSHDARGFGATLMTTWSQALGGSWSWTEGRTGGVVVSAQLPMDQPASH